MMRFLALALALALVSLAASADAEGFALDLEWDEFRKKTGRLVVSDLHVGETGLVNPSFCQMNNRVFIPEFSALTEKNEFGSSFGVERLPGRRVSVRLIVPDRDARDGTPRAKELADERMREIFSGPIQKCELFELFAPYGKPPGSIEFLLIDSINGHSTLSKLLGD